MQFPDLYILHEMGIGTEGGPIEALKAIEKIQVDEIIPYKIKRKRAHHGRNGPGTASAHGSSCAERSIAAAFFIPLIDIIITVMQYFILHPACFAPHFYFFMYKALIEATRLFIKKTQKIPPAFLPIPEFLIQEY